MLLVLSFTISKHNIFLLTLYRVLHKKRTCFQPRVQHVHTHVCISSYSPAGKYAKLGKIFWVQFLDFNEISKIPEFWDRRIRIVVKIELVRLLWASFSVEGLTICLQIRQRKIFGEARKGCWNDIKKFTHF